jgi:hypothetical protein
MVKSGLIAVTLIAAGMIVMPVSAQSAPALPPNAETVHRIELGAGVGVGALLSGTVDDLATGGPGVPLFPSVRVRLNFSPRFALEFRTDFDSPHELRNDFGPAAHSGVLGVYSVQVRQTLGDPDRRQTWFVTYGGAGQFNHVHESQTTWTWNNGDAVVWSASTHGSLTAPLVPVVGFGYRMRLRERLVFEAGAQVETLPPYAFVPTASAALLIPIGR